MREEFEYQSEYNDQTALWIVPLISMVGPFGLWLIEQPFPYPHLIEEGFKFTLINWLLKENNDISSFIGAMITGGIFAISETIFFFFNMASLANISSLLGRVSLTIPMHTVTAFVMITSAKKFGTAGKVCGLLFAVSIHYGFNKIVAII